jgi:hypothetical protein
MFAAVRREESGDCSASLVADTGSLSPVKVLLSSFI